MEEVVGMLIGTSSIDLPVPQLPRYSIDLPVPKQQMDGVNNLDDCEEEIYPSEADYSTDEEFDGR